MVSKQSTIGIIIAQHEYFNDHALMTPNRELSAKNVTKLISEYQLKMVHDLNGRYMIIEIYANTIRAARDLNLHYRRISHQGGTRALSFFRQLTLAILSVLAVTACATSSGSNESLASDLAQPDSTSIAVTADTEIAPLDVVNIRVFGVADLSGDYQVGPDGQIKVPLIGTVEASGQSVMSLAMKLETMLGETYLIDPDVTISVDRQNSSQEITVEGSVNRPGIYPVRGDVSLLQAVALGGGLSDTANPKKVVIFRQIDGERRAAGFDLEAIRRGEADDPVIYGNDIVVVDGDEARETYGDVLRSVPLLLFLF